jgi:hypothetical protein
VSAPFARPLALFDEQEAAIRMQFARICILFLRRLCLPLALLAIVAALCVLV